MTLICTSSVRVLKVGAAGSCCAEAIHAVSSSAPIAMRIIS
jgi:hypothetical protein